MESSQLISLYGFAVVALSLGAPCVVIWLLVRICGRGSARAPHSATPDHWPREDWSEAPVKRRQAAMPPPAPREEREYFDAAAYAHENNLPPPPLPPRDVREDW